MDGYPLAQPGHVTQLLRRYGGGDRAAADELGRIARAHMAAERSNHTLQPTALVHEAWARLAGARVGEVNDRHHFLALSARVMRQVLVAHARTRDAQKRGGDRERVPLDVVVALYEQRSYDVLALNEALDRLSGVDEQLGRVVELRFFGGLSNGEVSEAMDLPLRSVERAWATARAWLRDALGSPA